MFILTLLPPPISALPYSLPGMKWYDGWSGVSKLLVNRTPPLMQVGGVGAEVVVGPYDSHGFELRISYLSKRCSRASIMTLYDYYL